MIRKSKINKDEHKVVTRSGKSYNDSDVKFFKNSAGDKIFSKYWIPEEGSVKGLVFIIHGFAEHCQRYDSFAKDLNSQGLMVFSHDHVLHGENPGYFEITNYQQFIDDAKQHATLMKEKHPDLPMFLFGHSMGGCVSLFLVKDNPTLFNGLILSSPYLAPSAEFTPFKVAVAKRLYTWLPRLPIGRLDPNQISSDKDQVKKYIDDPLIYSGRVNLQTALQLYNMVTEVQSCFELISLPFLVLHGVADEVALISFSRNLIESSPSTDKFKVEFEGAKHELLHERDDIPETFAANVKLWINKRI